MWLRRDDSDRAPVVPAAGEPSAWDGVPRVPVAPLVIRAERAGDAPVEPPTRAA